MNINRDNYESFFLLYIDNELSVAERKTLDAFVLANPDLLEELEMLQQSVLLPDNIKFDFKKSLLKTEQVNSNLQEKLLLHLDNELSATGKNEIEQLIGKNAAIEQEWNELQAVKLTADETIVFVNKDSLYHREPGRLIGFQWRKLAAAAVLIGVGIWGGMQYLKTDRVIKAGAYAIKKNVEKPAGILPAPSLQTIPADTAVTINSEEIATITRKAITTPSTTNNAGKAYAVKSYDRKAIENNGNETTVAAQTKDNNLPKPHYNNLNNNTSNNSVIAAVTLPKQPDLSIDPAQNGAVNTVAKLDATEEYVSVASFTESSEESNNHVLFMDAEKVKKTKIGGFFKKVKRVVERTTNIKTGGNNFKVANLEFTIQ